jgi:hypothetical protein
VGRRLSLLLISVAVLVAGAPPSAAQDPEVTADVITQPVWHSAKDDLDLGVRIRNGGPEPIEGYIVTVAAHARVLSRSELHESFDEPTTFEASSITAVDAPDKTIPSGGEVRLKISEPVASLQSLGSTSEPGVYPLTISVFDQSGLTLATTTTQLIYYPSTPEFPLPAVPVISIADLPRRAPNGTFEEDTDGGFPLEVALERRGWLAGLVRALDAATTPTPPPPTPRRGEGRKRTPPPPPPPEPLHAAVVMMPRLAEELSDMSDGYRRDDEDGGEGQTSPHVDRARAVLDKIKEIAGRPAVQPVLAPYSFPDLPSMFDLFESTSSLPTDHVDQQLREAEEVLAESLNKAPPRTWIYSPGGRLNQISLENLQLHEARSTFFAQDSLEPLENPIGGGCPEPPLSFTCPVKVATSVGETTGYVLDADVQQRVADIARGEEGRAAIQRLFAETAMIREEVPSRVDRAIAIAFPGIWSPQPWVTELLFDGLRDAPWLKTYTPREGLGALAEETEPVARRIRSIVPRLTNQPDDGYLQAIADADEVVNAFRGIQPPPSLLQRLSRNTLVSESRLWWRDPALLEQGEGYASDATDEAERELGKITIGGSDEVALTSRSAEVPIVIFNDASYEASLRVRMDSTDLGLEETFPITVQANGLRQLTVDVAAQSSGIFPLVVTVETPDGTFITDKSIQVRSTEFNEIALGLTFGALAFLILFYITRAIRGRRSRVEPAG